ncbi:hypothetical protein ACIG3E_23330 [Streptomyces sp. NPDC053474]|uniref:hypothetical protein n=1 Tax=Streptomyces sp. NPDC053474 TaxID=3365704 RepID=UPI0037D10A31
MAHRTSSPLRTLAAVLRALLGLAVLVAAVAAAPWLLLKFGVLEVPGGLEALTQPDDGRLFLTVLTGIGWAAWAAFTAAALIETAALIRRRSAPRIKGLSGMQSLTSALIGGIVLLAPTAASAAPSAAAVAVATADPGPASSVPAAPAADAGQDDHGRQWPRHTVTGATESPAGLAEKYLGNWQRWKDIAALNPDVPALAAGDSYLPKGTVLKLPADARTRPHSDSATDTGAEPQLATSKQPAGKTGHEHIVTPHETLSDIAEDEYGDASLYPTLFEANKGERQPQGHRFTSPDLIYPGQKITVPDRDGAPRDDSEADRVPDEPSQASPPRANPDAAPGGDAATPSRPAPSKAPKADTEPTTPNTPDASAAPGRSAAPPAGSSQSPSSPSARPTPDKTERAAGATSTDSSPVAAVLAIAGSGFLAAAVVAMLTRRRIMQHRRRRHGRKIAMPTGRAAATEQLLRSVDAGAELIWLDTALRTLAGNLAANQRALPPLAAVQLGAEGLLLHLAPTTGNNPAPAPAPFTARGDGLWWCPADSDQLADDEQLRELDAPYPALVQIGEDAGGSMVLVDLEQYGALHLTGEHRLQALHMLVLSLALPPAGGQIEIAVAGEDTAPGLSVLDDRRVTPYPGLAEATEAARAHHLEQQQALTTGASTDLAHARPDEEFGELWPLIVLADLDTCPGAHALTDLTELVTQTPRSATAVITSSSAPTPAPGAPVWVIDTGAPSLPVPGTQLECTLALCPDDVYTDILDQALTADSPTDLPRPTAPPQKPKTLVPAPQTPPAEPTAVPETGPSSTAGLLAHLADLTDDSTPSTPPETEGAPPAEASAEPGSQSGPSDSPSHIALPSAITPTRISARLPAEASEPAAAPSRLPGPGAVPPREQDAVELPSGQPMVRILGPVVLTGARGHLTSNRATMALELATWLVLHPGADRYGIDGVIAPDGRVTRDTRNSRISDVRRWLGRNDDGDHYFPQISTQPDKRYRLVGVECDWDHFQYLYTAAQNTPSEHGEQFLRRALHLVRGRPFAQIPTRRYSWAEPLTNDIIELVTDAAHELADRCLRRSDGRGALWAASRGLDVAREREDLWRLKIRALDLLGNSDDLEQAIRQLEQLLVDLDILMENKTAEMLSSLRTSTRR